MSINANGHRLSVNNNTVCPDGLTCNNGTATPPTLPTQPKPKDPKNTKSAPKLTGNPCAEGQCWHDCDCGPGLTPADFAIPSTDDSKAQALQAESIPICPEGQCFSDCECSVDGLMAFINPGIPLASMPRVCASGECSTDCICRDDLVKTAQVVASLRKHHSRYDYFVPNSFSSLTTLDSSKLKKGANQKVLAGKSEL